MSNYLAIATVTATLAMVVRDAMRTVTNVSHVPDVKVAGPIPDANFVGAHMLLFRVSPNPAARNDDLPTRNGDGRTIQRPRYPADLEFLLSFYGKDSSLEAQRLMGRVITVLHSEPVLTGERVRKAIQENLPALEGSDLDRAAEPVRLTPVPLELSDLSAIWSGFHHVPYVALVAYSASIAWLDAALTPIASPAATQFVPSATPRLPVVTAVEPPVFVAGENDRVRVSGANFPNDAVVQFGDLPVATDTQNGALLAAPPDAAIGTVPVRAGAASAPSDPVPVSIVPYVGSPVIFRAGFVPPQGSAEPGVPPTVSVSLSVRPNVRQSFEFLLFSTATSASAVRPALLTWLANAYVVELAQHSVSATLASALLRAGVNVAAGDPVTVVAPDRWRIRSASQDVALEAAGDVVTVAYGLAADPGMMLACAVDGIAEGAYAIALRVDGRSDVTSPFLRGSNAFPFAGAAEPKDGAPLADDVRAAFAERGVTFDPNAVTRRPAPGNEWLVVEPTGPSRGRLVWDAAAPRLDGYVLSATGPVIAPIGVIEAPA